MDKRVWLALGGLGVLAFVISKRSASAALPPSTIPDYDIGLDEEIQMSKDLPTGRAAWEPLIKKISAEYGLPSAWLLTTVRFESNFKPAARNNVGGDAARGGAWGLAQVTLATARGLGYTGEPAGLLDPELNLRLAAKLHVENGAPKGAPKDVFAKYNSGKVYAKAPIAAQKYADMLYAFFMTEITRVA